MGMRQVFGVFAVLAWTLCVVADEGCFPGFISVADHVPPHAAFMATGVPSAAYVPIIRTGCGTIHAFALKDFI